MLEEMDLLTLREREPEVDLESGGTTSEEDRTNDPISENRQTNKLFDWMWSVPLSFDGFFSSLGFGEAGDENGGFLMDKNSEGEECQQNLGTYADKEHADEKRKNSRKPPKPPRPPKGPSLDAADLKLVQELTELAMRKRARFERLKALRKMRAAKASSWNQGSVYAMIITVLFCLAVVFHGICSRNTAEILLQGSPEPEVAASDGLISVQFSKNFTIYDSDALGSGSSNLAEKKNSRTGLRKR